MLMLEGFILLNMFEKMGVMVIDDGGVVFIVGKLVGGGMIINWFVFLKIF